MCRCLDHSLFCLFGKYYCPPLLHFKIIDVKICCCYILMKVTMLNEMQTCSSGTFWVHSPGDVFHTRYLFWHQTQKLQLLSIISLVCISTDSSKLLVSGTLSDVERDPGENTLNTTQLLLQLPHSLTPLHQSLNSPPPLSS